MENKLNQETAAEIENLILSEIDLDKQIEIYKKHYSLVKNSGRLTTNGPQNVKFFCSCRNCQKEPDYSQKLSIYNRHFDKELKQFVENLNGFSDYKDKLKFYDSYLDNGTQGFEGLDITLSIKPSNAYENKVFNEFQYRRFLDNYFLNYHNSLKNYYQLDFNSRRKAFIKKRLNATYPEQSAGKEIILLNKHFETHWNEKTNQLFKDLVDGISLDFGSEEWSYNRCLEVVEANEGVKFLKYLENVNRGNSGHTKLFHQIIQQSHEAYESFSVVTWNTINDCIQEIKDKLYELTNDDSRKAYLKTTLLSFKITGFEDYFKEVEEYLGDDIDVNSGFEAAGNVVWVTNIEKSSSLSEGIASIIKGRNTIVLEVSEHLIDVYPSIDFNEIMEAVDYRTKSTFWISSARFSNVTKGFLANFADAEKLYNSGVDKIQKGIYERNSLDDLRLSLELLLRKVLGNEKSLENQRASINEFFKTKNASPQIANMLWTLIEQYSKYQNDSVKHNDKIQHKEIDIILDLTTTFIKHVLQHA